MKKRGELLLILGESEKEKQDGSKWNQSKGSSNEIVQAIELMRSARDLYFKQWGDSHPKSLDQSLLLGRFELIGAFYATNKKVGKMMFEDADSTFSGLLSLHEFLYRDLNQNHSSKVIEDKKLILHRDIYNDYKYKLIACIFSENFEQAEDHLIQLKKLGNLLLSPFEQTELL